jgi:hypothetical protein
VFEAPEIVLLVTVCVAAIPARVSVAAGKENVFAPDEETSESAETVRVELPHERELNKMMSTKLKNRKAYLLESSTHND